MNRMTELAANLTAKGYEVACFEKGEEAVAFLSSRLDGTTIGIGGSQTVAQLGLFPALASHNTVFWHDQKPEDMTVAETRLAACHAPVYISSANGVSLQGDIINIDGSGNRVSATTYGPEDVYFVIGMNKVADTFEDAMWRARNIAAPLNAKRLNRKTPCAVMADHCYDCNSPERICCVFSVFHQPPYGPKYHVVLINQELGY